MDVFIVIHGTTDLHNMLPTSVIALSHVYTTISPCPLAHNKAYAGLVEIYRHASTVPKADFSAAQMHISDKEWYLENMML